MKKKVVGSAQKLRVGRGALNTAIFFFWPKHHELMEQDIHQIDKRIGLQLAETNLMLFCYEKEFSNFVSGKKKGKNIDFPVSKGPVMKAVNLVLYKHGIVKHGYHGGGFVGNHCTLYVQDNVVEEVAT